MLTLVHQLPALPCYANNIDVLTLLQELAEGSDITLEGKKEDDSTYSVPLTHTFNANQLKWFKAGSALNAVRRLPLVGDNTFCWVAALCSFNLQRPFSSTSTSCVFVYRQSRHRCL